MKRLLLCLVVAACAWVTATAHAAKPKPKPKHVSCGATFGVITPATGAAAVVGQEILNWTRLAVSNWNKAHHDHFSLVEGDDQLSAAEASTIAQQFASNSKIVATVGPAASQNVSAAGPILDKAHIAMVSPSATATNLTIGASFHDFFRVVARDDEQGPTAANYIIKQLHPKRVMIVDDQSSFSTGLAESATPVFQKAGVTVDRESIAQTATDYSALVAKASSADVVFLTWQLAANIKLFVQQLQQQGRTTPTFASTFDGGTNYVSSFSVNAHTYPPDAAISKQYEKAYGTNYTGQFGPPSYVAAQVIMTAADGLCAAHKKVTRTAMLAAIRKVKLKTSILGRPIAFDRNGDLIGGKFYIYKLVNGNYELVQ
jgi:branched-chain amino acid transport system substrate-binding protein